MGTYTNKKNLYKPNIGEENWGDKVNNNFDILDNFADVSNDVYVTNPGLRECDSAILEETFSNGIDGNWTIAYSGITGLEYEILESRGIVITFSGVTTASGGMGGIYYPVVFDKDLDFVLHIDVAANFERIKNENSGTVYFFAGMMFTDNPPDLSPNTSARVGIFLDEDDNRTIYKSDDTTFQIYNTKFQCQNYIKASYRHSDGRIFVSSSNDGIFWKEIGDSDSTELTLTITSGYVGIGVLVYPNVDYGDIVKLYSRKFTINCSGNFKYLE